MLDNTYIAKPQAIASDNINIKGPQTIAGKVKVSGAKNSILPIMVASLLSNSSVTLHNVPSLNDVFILKDIMNEIGREATIEGKQFNLYKRNLYLSNNVSEKASKIRYSVLLLGALLATEKRVILPLPGGCGFSTRPIDIHLDGLRKLGARITEVEGALIAETDGLVGTNIELRFPSVGATENLIIASVLAKGTTILRNIAIEPEIIDLINFLNNLGAKIHFNDNAELKIIGVEKLGEKHLEYKILSDRIEAATFLVLGALMAKEFIVIENFNIEHNLSFLNIVQQIGVKFDLIDANTIKVYKSYNLRSVDVTTGVYPNLATDIQPLLAVLLTQAKGESTIIDTIYPTRFQYADELNRMGANVEHIYSGIKVKGVTALKGEKVYSHDLRGGAAMVLAGLIADGTTIVENSYQIFRGYSNLRDKLLNLGIEI